MIQVWFYLYLFNWIIYHIIAQNYCTTVISCKANGVTTCDRTTGLCPPCLFYVIGGYYTCYPIVPSSKKCQIGFTANCINENKAKKSTTTTTTAPSTSVLSNNKTPSITTSSSKTSTNTNKNTNTATTNTNSKTNSSSSSLNKSSNSNISSSENLTESGSSLSLTMILIISGGGLFVFLLLLTILYCILRPRSKRKKRKNYLNKTEYMSNNKKNKKNTKDSNKKKKQKNKESIPSYIESSGTHSFQENNDDSFVESPSYYQKTTKNKNKLKKQRSPSYSVNDSEIDLESLSEYSDRSSVVSGVTLYEDDHPKKKTFNGVVGARGSDQSDFLSAYQEAKVMKKTNHHMNTQSINETESVTSSFYTTDDRDTGMTGTTGFILGNNNNNNNNNNRRGSDLTVTSTDYDPYQESSYGRSRRKKKEVEI